MSRLTGTKTQANLLKAFAGESQARNRYTFFASRAKKDGYVQIQKYFQETADNEKEHAEVFYKYLVEGMEDGSCDMLDLNASYPVALADTYHNLLNAAAGEKEEWDELYPAFAKDAEEEGFKDIATSFTEICVAEKAHEARYLKLAKNIEQDKVFKRFGDVRWKCGNCGYIHEGNEAPDECPACKHAKEYFQLFVEDY